jgi:hypothetical protein
MTEQKKFLEASGWACSTCGCQGKKGWDCGNKNKRGYIITLRDNGFKIFNKGHTIDVGHLYQLETKMKAHGIL